MKRALLGAMALACLGCDDPLVDPQTLIGPRILAARVRTDADPEVAQPLAGEGARIDWLVASDRAWPLRGRAAFCVSSAARLGLARCAAAPFLEMAVCVDAGQPLSLAFELPRDLAPGDSWLSLLWLCESGAPEIDPGFASATCDDGSPALVGLYRGRIPLGSPNHNPSLSDARLRLGGADWPATSGPARPGEACDGELPVVRPQEPTSVDIELPPSVREELPDDELLPREPLLLTHVLSTPGLERAYSAVDPSADALRMQVMLELPPSAGDAASLPRREAMIFVLRDERGGVDFTTRELCVAAP